MIGSKQRTYVSSLALGDNNVNEIRYSCYRVLRSVCCDLPAFSIFRKSCPPQCHAKHARHFSGGFYYKHATLHAFQKCYQTFHQESLELVRFVIHSMWVNIYLIIIVITIILVLRELRKLRVRSIGDHPEIYFLTTCF